MAVESANGDLLRIVTLLAAAVVAVPLFKRLGLGSILGYLAAGLIIGPFGLGLITDSHAILHIAEFGVVMFLFLIGLEMKPSHLWQLRGQIFGLGTLQVALSTLLLTLMGLAYGFSPVMSFISAVGFTLTSTAMVMQIMDERHEINTPQGQRIVSVLLFEDLLIVPMLAIVAFLAPENPQAVVDHTPLWQKIAVAGVSLTALLVAGIWLLNPLFKTLAKSKAREVMTAAALLVVLGAAYLMELGGLSMAMGAFLAGVLLSESDFRHQLEADIEPFRGLLLGLFFLGVGMSLDLAAVVNNWKIILSATVFSILLKSLAIYLIGRVSKTDHHTALHRAVLMSQGGEFAFVLFSAAAAQQAINAEVLANMTAIVVLSMIATPFAVMLFDRFTRRSGNSNRAAVDDVEQHAGELNGNVLIIGFGRVGQIVSQMPLAYGASISILDNDPDTITAAREYGFKIYYGDATRSDVLHASGVEHTDIVAVCVDNGESAVQIVQNIRLINPRAKVFVRAWDRRNALALVKAEANCVVRETFHSSMKMGDEIVKALGASVSELRAVHDKVRDADRERFALEVAGKEFEGRSLLLGNMKK
ncbi:monovalent cation:proton antiporter-2 (CPA2) family protein [Pasteurellaceae bacterium LIM206]|nr:monovalent cation:proton antiporter-2 (CPA2) family protein [Pasteurellaceae bacterium LIM206]